jgi:ribosomal protein L11 methyltransferase
MKTDLYAQLMPIIQKIGRSNVWRSVYDKDNQLIVEGVGRWNVLLEEALDSLDFAGKSVVDLGCNLGFYSFFATRKGARRVLGIDIDSDMIAGCNVLKAYHGMADVEFRKADFLIEDLKERFDIVLMLDFIGKNIICKGKLTPSLAAIQKLSRGEILISLHPEYHIARAFQRTPEEFQVLYPSEFIRGERFFLIDYVRSFFKPPWQERRPYKPEHRSQNVKHPLSFIRTSYII